MRWIYKIKNGWSVLLFPVQRLLSSLSSILMLPRVTCRKNHWRWCCNLCGFWNFVTFKPYADIITYIMAVSQTIKICFFVNFMWLLSLSLFILLLIFASDLCFCVQKSSPIFASWFGCYSTNFSWMSSEENDEWIFTQ